LIVHQRAFVLVSSFEFSVSSLELVQEVPNFSVEND
jgi:hypothetical protein